MRQKKGLIHEFGGVYWIFLPTPDEEERRAGGEAASAANSYNVFLLVVTSLGCLTLTLQHDVSGLFSHSSAEGKKFLCAHNRL